MKVPIFMCVYRSGGHYGKDYVEKLKESVDKYSTMEFRCLSDDPTVPGYLPLEHDWPGWWSKMELFRPDIEQDILYMDLDTVLCGPISLIESVCGKHSLPIMLRDFYSPERLASGVMWLPKRYRGLVWKAWTKDPIGVMARCGSYGDQMLIGEVYAGLAMQWQSLLPDTFASYKAHVLKKVPPTVDVIEVEPELVKVVCYHGRPRPRETGWEGIEKVLDPS